MEQIHRQVRSVAASVPAPPPRPETLTLAQLSGLLQKNERTVRAMRSAGLLPAALPISRRPLLWSLAEITAWMAAGCPDQQVWERDWLRRPSRPGRGPR